MTMTHISTITVGAGGASSIEFTGIPQTGTDLLVVLSGRTTAPTSADCYISLNGAYTNGHRRLQGNGSTASSTSIDPVFRVPATSYTANTFGSTSIYVTNYTSSSAKSLSIDSVVENNATEADFSGIVAATKSMTSPVMSIGVGYSAIFAQYSTASLYIISTSGATGATVS